MRRDEDAVRIMRAELCRRLAALEQLSGRSRPRDFSRAVIELRELATTYEFLPVMKLAEALECVPPGPSSRRSVGLFLDRMQDAIACDRLDPRAGEAMLASIAIRRAF